MMDDLMQMARQAGAHDDGFEVRFKEPRYLERFAALVIANHPPQSFMTWQEGCEAGKQAEREACAKVCESLWHIDGQLTANEFAAEIREMSNT